MNRAERAIIMAAGLGNRMRPVTLPSLSLTCSPVFFTWSTSRVTVVLVVSVRIPQVALLV